MEIFEAIGGFEAKLLRATCNQELPNHELDPTALRAAGQFNVKHTEEKMVTTSGGDTAGRERR